MIADMDFSVFFRGACNVGWADNQVIDDLLPHVPHLARVHRASEIPKGSINMVIPSRNTLAIIS